LKGEEPITCRPADRILPAMNRLREELRGVTDSEEDILTYALFPHIAIDYFKRRDPNRSFQPTATS
jgi:pyruvate/oxaloacetate carboxyltransferase